MIDRKVSRGQVFLVTDGGLHHHLAASGNFGQVIRKNYPVAIGNRWRGGRARGGLRRRPAVHAAGLLADRMELAAARPATGRRVPVRRLRAHGEPDALPGPPAAARGARLRDAALRCQPENPRSAV